MVAEVTRASSSAMASPNFDASEARRFASADLWKVSISASSVESVLRKNVSYKSMSLLQRGRYAGFSLANHSSR